MALTIMAWIFIFGSTFLLPSSLAACAAVRLMTAQHQAGESRQLSTCAAVAWKRRRCFLPRTAAWIFVAQDIAPCRAHTAGP
jgi:hypothetical protein